MLQQDNMHKTDLHVMLQQGHMHKTDFARNVAIGTTCIKLILHVMLQQGHHT